MLQASDNITDARLTAGRGRSFPRRETMPQSHASWILQTPASKPAVGLVCRSWAHRVRSAGRSKRDPEGGTCYFEVSGKEAKTRHVINIQQARAVQRAWGLDSRLLPSPEKSFSVGKWHSIKTCHFGYLRMTLSVLECQSYSPIGVSSFSRCPVQRSWSRAVQFLVARVSSAIKRLGLLGHQHRVLTNQDPHSSCSGFINSGLSLALGKWRLLGSRLSPRHRIHRNLKIKPKCGVCPQTNCIRTF